MQGAPKQEEKKPKPKFSFNPAVVEFKPGSVQQEWGMPAVQMATAGYSQYGAPQMVAYNPQAWGEIPAVQMAAAAYSQYDAPQMVASNPQATMAAYGQMYGQQLADSKGYGGALNPYTARPVDGPCTSPVLADGLVDKVSPIPPLSRPNYIRITPTGTANSTIAHDQRTTSTPS